MSDETTPEEIEPPSNTVIGSQLEVLSYISELDHEALYDEWKEQKILVISKAMRIIAKAQNIMLKELK